MLWGLNFKELILKLISLKCYSEVQENNLYVGK